ncbi:MAG: recombinase family protein [Lachnospiraceae bacterium]|nr:recombinase family protein [Lachnospiraceae bacterium]
MENKRRAWIYCAIDAPEDGHKVLKRQRQELMSYAKHMGFETVGSSIDLGGRPLWERYGFHQLVDAVQEGRVDVLLIANPGCLSRAGMQLARFEAWVKHSGLRVFSPLTGEILQQRRRTDIE